MDREDILQNLSRQVAMDVMGLDLDRGMGHGAVLPRFCSDIGAAWQIVDQMTRRFEGMKLKLIQDELGWRAAFSDQVISTAPLEASGLTPAEAICSAALAAVKRRRSSKS
ncbi:MAG: BC1872 family protein [Gemmatimonadales bacterium]